MPFVIKRKIFKIPYIYLFFIASALFAEVRRYILPVRKYTAYFNLMGFVLTVIGSVMYLFIFIHCPILESIKFPVRRGSITPRHNKFLAPEDKSSTSF